MTMSHRTFPIEYPLNSTGIIRSVSYDIEFILNRTSSAL